MNKKALEILLSNLLDVDNADVKLEQYETESSIAADVLWWAFMNGDVTNKVIADLGCGNGVLGLGAALLEAKKVYLVDKDKRLLDAAEENLKDIKVNNVKILNKDINDFNYKVDTVIQNPPFGVKTRNADRIFLIKAMEISRAIYSFHKIESKEFIEKLTRENGFEVMGIKEIKMLIKKRFKFHKKDKYYVDVGVWRLKKVKEDING